jgi:hypothetical protein
MACRGTAFYLITLSTFSIPVFPKDWPEDGTFMPKHVASNVIHWCVFAFLYAGLTEVVLMNSSVPNDVNLF